MKRNRSSGLRMVVLTGSLLLGATLPVHAQPSTTNVEPPRNIEFRDLFVGRDGEILRTNVVPPDSIVFRQPFVRRGADGSDVDVNPNVTPPRGIAFREPFLGRGGDAIREDVQAPRGIVFRPLFLARNGEVLDPDVDAPEGIVFRDVFLGRDGIVTGVRDVPSNRLLDRASVLPNPFNPSTQIGFRLARAAEVSVAVYDTRGRLVRVLARERLDADAHVMTWDGTDDQGNAVSSGVYLVRIAAGDETLVVKGVLVE